MTWPTRKPLLFSIEALLGAEVLRQLAPADRNIIGQDLMRAQSRWPVGMPLCRPLGGGLWEVRSDLTGQSHRPRAVLFFGRTTVSAARLYQEDPKTPDAELALARKRMREFK